jgi:methionyl-tRNA formyltransferase
VKVVFFGSGPFALPTLETLARGPSKTTLARVVTRPDRPQRRGKKLAPTPVRSRATDLGLSCDAPETANDSAYVEVLRGLSPDLFVVADYGEMLRKPLREVPAIGIFNLHGSILPRWRGAAPVVHSILHGDGETGVTLFRIEKGLDSGPVVDAERTTIAPTETAGELEPRLATLAARLLERSLDAFAARTFRETPQDDRLATLAPKVEKRDGAIVWDAPAIEVTNRVRAFNPWPGAYSFLGGERTIFLRVAPSATSLPGAAPGSVAAVTKDGFKIQCGTGSVDVLEVQREGKAALGAAEYLRGRPLKPGDRFAAADGGASGAMAPE